MHPEELHVTYASSPAGDIKYELLDAKNPPSVYTDLTPMTQQNTQVSQQLRGVTVGNYTNQGSPQHVSGLSSNIDFSIILEHNLMFIAKSKLKHCSFNFGCKLNINLFY